MATRKLILDGWPAQNPSLVLLRSRGYELGVAPADETRKEIGYWFARRDGLEFRAGDPLCLLGIVTLWEARGSAKRLDDDEDLYTQLAWDYL